MREIAGFGVVAAIMALAPPPAFAFDPARCAEVRRAEGLDPAAMPTPPVHLAAEPGLFGGEVGCQLSFRSDGGVDLMAYEFVPNEGDMLSVNYLASGVVVMLQTAGGEAVGRVLMCRPGAPGVQCHADLFVDGTLTFELGMGASAADEVMGLWADVPAMLSAEPVPALVREVTLSLAGQADLWPMSVLNPQDGSWALADVADVVELFREVTMAREGEAPGLKLDVAYDTPTGPRILSREQDGETLRFILDAAVTIGTAIQRQETAQVAVPPPGQAAKP
jgi:hypothetical protein